MALAGKRKRCTMNVKSSSNKRFLILDNQSIEFVARLIESLRTFTGCGDFHGRLKFNLKPDASASPCTGTPPHSYVSYL
jgi:hypothetical protein